MYEIFSKPCNKLVSTINGKLKTCLPCFNKMKVLTTVTCVFIIVLHVAYMDPALNVKGTLNKRILPRKPISYIVCNHIYYYGRMFSIAPSHGRAAKKTEI